MAPWGADSELSTVTAEKAISFISKSWLDVRKCADEDIKRMRARAKSFTDLANSFDRELENFRKASLNLGSESSKSGSFFRTFKDNGGLQTALNKSHFEDLDFLRKPLSEFRRSHSNPDLANQQNQIVQRQGGTGSLLKKALTPRVNEEDFYLKGVEGLKKQRAVRSRKLIVREWPGNNNSQKFSRDHKPFPDEWEPLRRMKESWKDLEITASSSKSPSEFFDNLKKTQLFENVRKNLKLSLSSNEF